MLYIDSLRNGLERLLEKDERVYLLGEDITEPYGGSFKVTKGLSAKYSERMLATPMSEQGFTGMAVGMALGGLYPIVEIMFGDFLSLALDQLLNHASKFSALYNSELHLVLRTPMGGHRGYGATHSQSIERISFGIPYVDVVAPSVLIDPAPLLISAVAKGNTIVFIENKMDYGKQLVVGSELEPEVRVSRSLGQFPVAITTIIDADSYDTCIIAYGGAVTYAMEAQKNLFMDYEINVKVIAPSWVNGLNFFDLISYIGTCEKIVIAEEGISDFGWGEHVFTGLREAGFSGKISRLGARNAVVGASLKDEAENLLSSKKIEEAVHEAIK